MPRRSTPARLSRLRLVLVGATLLGWLAAEIMLVGAQTTVRTARARTSPALLDALQIRAALSDADRAAWASFRSGEAALLGPGQTYQNDITTASQHLAHLAEIGVVASADLQTIEGQLVNYQGLVEQADASYRAGLALGRGSRQQLGFAYLSYASSSLRDAGGLLARIGDVVDAQIAELDTERRSRWIDSALLLGPASAALLLLGCLCHTQAFLSRRFHRVVNASLLMATALLVGLASWGGLAVVHSGHMFHAAQQTTLPRVIQIWRDQTDQADRAALALRRAPAPSTQDHARSVLDVSATRPVQDLLDAQLAGASASRALLVGLPALAAAVAGLCVLGLRPRLREYRGWRP